MKQPAPPGIGRLNEAPLHASLKEYYACENAQMEAPVDGYIVDVKRGDLLIEIQTGGFSAIKTKLQRLVENHPLLLVYPVALEKWIVKRPKDDAGKETRRKSPKQGKVVEVFRDLVSFPHLLLDDHFTLEIVLTQEEDIRCYNGKRRWRNAGWVTEERRLIRVVEQHTIRSPQEFLPYLPSELPQQFSTADLSNALRISRRMAQKMSYCLRRMKVFHEVGRKNRSILYEVQTECLDD